MPVTPNNADHLQRGTATRLHQNTHIMMDLKTSKRIVKIFHSNLAFIASYEFLALFLNMFIHVQCQLTVVFI